MDRPIVVATVKSWNLLEAERLSKHYDVRIIERKEDLTPEKIREINPSYIFFPHWSWMIPDEIFNNFVCVVFHMTDLPFGRGGSPLQNLINRGIFKTKISALKVEHGLDTGPIYLKKDLDLSNGNADEMLQRASRIIFREMIPAIAEMEMDPKPQEGEPLLFKRRKPEESELDGEKIETPEDLYHFVRMLDGEGYPAAFFQVGNMKVKLSGAKMENGKVEGKWEVEIDE